MHIFKILALFLTLLLFDGCEVVEEKKSLVSKPLTDNTPPIITLNGEANITLLSGLSYIEKKAWAKDNRDGYLKVSYEGEVTTNKVGRYKIRYYTQDSAGNQAQTYRTIQVIKTLPPLIKLHGKNEIVVAQGSPYLEMGVTETSVVVGNLSLEIEGEVNSNQLGDYTLSYIAKDSLNHYTKLTRMIHVVDKTPPTIHLRGNSLMKLAQNMPYKEEGAVAIDTVDGKVSVIISGHVNTKKVGTYTITYHAKDSVNNQSKKIRTIQIIDVTPPILTLKGDDHTRLLQYEAYKEEGATAFDEVDKKVEVFRSGAIDNTTLGTYKLLYTAQDSTGNKTAKTRVIEVYPSLKVKPELLLEENRTK